MAKLIQLNDSAGELYPKLFYKNYTITRIDNSYADATAVGRIALIRVGNVGFLHFNFFPSASIPAEQNSFTEIGSFDCTLIRQSLHTVAGQAGTATITVNITTDGIVRILNGSSTASGTSGYRAVIPVIFTDDSN